MKTFLAWVLAGALVVFGMSLVPQRVLETLPMSSRIGLAMMLFGAAALGFLTGELDRKIGGEKP